MEVTRDRIEELASAWLAEAKRLRSRALCDCGECNEVISVTGTRFKPGHDAKLLRKYRNQIRDVLKSK
jgi:hypothetical protein